MTFLIISLRFCNKKIFSFCNMYLGKASTTIKGDIKKLPMLSLQAWFLYLRHVLKCLWIWYNITGTYNCGCLCFSDKYAWDGSELLFSISIINYFYQWPTDKYFNDYYFIFCTWHTVTIFEYSCQKGFFKIYLLWILFHCTSRQQNSES